MKIEIGETTIASKNMEALKGFYAEILGPQASVQFRDFFYTLKRSGQVSIVPHNGDKKWDEPWITLTTDNLPEAIVHLTTVGVTEMDKFEYQNDKGEIVPGLSFRDPDGRLVMMVLEQFI